MKNYVLQIKNTAIVSCVNPVFIMKIHKPIIAVIDYLPTSMGSNFSTKKRRDILFIKVTEYTLLPGS